MGSDNEQQDQRLDRAVAAVLVTGSLKEAAREAGIAPSSFYRLTRTPEFQAKLKEAQKLVFDTAMARLQGLANEAVDVIEATLKGRFHDSLRFRAAMIVLENGKAQRDNDIEERLARLEERLR